VAVGDTNSSVSEKSEQVSILLGSYTQGSVIAIVDESGEEIFSFTLEQSKNNMILSVPGLESDGTYEVQVDGETDQTFTVDSQVISAGGSTDSMMGGGMGGGFNQGGGFGQGGNMPQMPDNNGDMSQNGGEMPQAGEMPEGDGTMPENGGNFTPGDGTMAQPGGDNQQNQFQ
jgi:hypothetical protein